MSMVPLTYYGVHSIGPENYLCALLHWEERGRIVPVWIPPIEGARLAARDAMWESDRPDTYDLMVSIIEQSTQGVKAIEISSYYHGTFVATLEMEDGEEIDARLSDALVLSTILDLPIEADETVLAQASLWISAEDARDQFGIDLPEAKKEESNSASGDAQADADFESLMRSLGVDESDIRGGDDSDEI
ncbi:bifunctional nuclease family protein [Corynebacterium sp. S7]